MAAENEEKDNKDGAKEEKKKEKKGSPISKLVLLLIVFDVLGVRAGVYMTYLGTIGTSKQAVRESDAHKELVENTVFGDKPIVYSLDPFTVNLSGEDERIVQIKVSLEMIDEDGFEEVVSMGAHARDTIVQILNAKEYEDLESIQGKLFLKDEITVALNKQMKRSFIKDIYFSGFVLQ